MIHAIIGDATLYGWPHSSLYYTVVEMYAANSDRTLETTQQRRSGGLNTRLTKFVTAFRRQRLSSEDSNSTAELTKRAVWQEERDCDSIPSSQSTSPDAVEQISTERNSADVFPHGKVSNTINPRTLFVDMSPSSSDQGIGQWSLTMDIFVNFTICSVFRCTRGGAGISSSVLRC
jgi:hypothetical protein